VEASISAYSRKSAPEGSVEKETMCDGVIQRFEYTFEPSWKMIKQYLENVQPGEAGWLYK
jgi:hypothetical protein